jgi:hypothetical protein
VRLRFPCDVFIKGWEGATGLKEERISSEIDIGLEESYTGEIFLYWSQTRFADLLPRMFCHYDDRWTTPRKKTVHGTGTSTS